VHKSAFPALRKIFPQVGALFQNLEDPAFCSLDRRIDLLLQLGLDLRFHAAFKFLNGSLKSFLKSFFTRFDADGFCILKKGLLLIFGFLNRVFQNLTCGLPYRFQIRFGLIVQILKIEKMSAWDFFFHESFFPAAEIGGNVRE